MARQLFWADANFCSPRVHITKLEADTTLIVQIQRKLAEA